jgi:hypothetical protein
MSPFHVKGLGGDSFFCVLVGYSGVDLTLIAERPAGMRSFSDMTSHHLVRRQASCFEGRTQWHSF